MIRQPIGQLAHRRLRQARQQLRQIPLRINAVPPTGAGHAAEDRRRPAATLVAYKQTVLPVQHHPLHLTLAHVVVDRHRAVADKHIQFRPLIQRVRHRLGHRMLGQQLIFPRQQPLFQRRQDRERFSLP